MNKKIISVGLALAVAIAAAAFVFQRRSAPPTPSAGGESNTTTASGTASEPDHAQPSPAAGSIGQVGTSTATPDSAAAPGATAAKPVPFSGSEAETESAEAQKAAHTPLKPEEKKALKMLTRALVKYIQPKYAKPDAMISDLKKAGLQPVVAKDFNEVTGKMLVVRSEKALEGQRYLHAQYFEDEEKQQFPQHISFELRPSADGMQEAIAAAEAAIKESNPKAALAKPIQVNADFVKFYLPENRELWIKKLDKDDLVGDPFNAHDPVADVGTYKIAVEQIPDDHGHEDGDHH